MDSDKQLWPADPTSPLCERETSPKRKRMDDVDETNKMPQGRANAGVPILPRRHVDHSARRLIADRTNNHIDRTMDEDVDDFLESCNARFASTKVLQEKHETALQYRLVNAITAVQITQARAGNDLLKLSNRLHDFAHHLNEQERYLHQQQAELIVQKTTMSKKLLDIVAKTLESGSTLEESSPETCKAKEMEKLKFNNEQLKFNISVHQTTIEVLISELMIEKEARKATEAKLQEKGLAGGDVAISLKRRDLHGDGVDDHTSKSSPIPSMPSVALSPVKRDIGRGEVYRPLISAHSPSVSSDSSSIGASDSCPENGLGEKRFPG